MSFCSHTSCGAGRCSYMERMDDPEGADERMAVALADDAREAATYETTDVEDLIRACAAAEVMLTSLRSYYIYDHKLGGKESENSTIQSIDVALGRIGAALKRRFERR